MNGLSRIAPLFAWALLANACSGHDMAMDAPPPQPSVTCNSDQSQCTYFHDFGQTFIKAGEERVDDCYTYTLNNPNDLLVNVVQLDNDGAFHHSNWFFVPQNSYSTDESLVRCHDIGFSEIGAALEGGVLFAQSTQSRSEAQRFPDGAFVRVPAYSRIIGEAHLLNASANDMMTGLRLTLTTMPVAQQKVELWPFRLSYTDLRIPPMQHSEFTGQCDLRAPSESTLGTPFYMKLYYVLPHFHAHGEMFQLQMLGGANPGSVIYNLQGTIGDPHGQTFDPPIDVSGAQGLTFTCGFNNTTDSEIMWGNGDAEMCVMLGFADAHARYDATVDNDKNMMDVSGVSMHSGPCGIAVYPLGQ